MWEAKVNSLSCKIVTAISGHPFRSQRGKSTSVAQSTSEIPIAHTLLTVAKGFAVGLPIQRTGIC